MTDELGVYICQNCGRAHRPSEVTNRDCAWCREGWLVFVAERFLCMAELGALYTLILERPDSQMREIISEAITRVEIDRVAWPSEET